MGGEKAAPSLDDDRQRTDDEHGGAVVDDDGAQTPPPVFQSRLRAKREERLQQRQLELEQELLNASATVAPHALEIDLNAVARGKREGASATKSSSRPSSQRSIRSTITVVDSPDDAALKRRERAEARKRVIDYQGSIWDAVRTNDLAMLHNYFLVEGAQTLLRRRHPDAEQGGRSLLHCAAWCGNKPMVEFVLATGCGVDTLDSAASRTTPLIEAARVGRADVCVALLRHGADPRHHDGHGDTAFHWAGRRGYGTVLLQMALELERLEGGPAPTLWVMKNYKGRTVIDLVQANAFVIPLLQKRLGHSFSRALESAAGKRRSRFPLRTTALEVTRRPSQATDELPISRSNAQLLEPDESAHTSTPPTLSGVQELGLDVSSFVYRSRDTLAS